ncbi:flavonol 3-O-glucosyltransferase UGT89B1 [Arachis stenosperma]|uniref:flavonol 3-O-glucosyltransferase UGT89B1 n=1 Tax=Arachis stenosperma TaxID=217475 RepID=UPI0025ACC5A4|nr:flavonol 3-O-glucosyltransferase UGT89B1 [Arachis stenosperma]
MNGPSGNNPPPPHILVVPFPSQGHMIPLLDLTHKLASTDTAITITILTTPKNLTFLDPLLSSFSAIIHPLVLPLPSHPSLPPGVENSKGMPTSVPSLMLSFSNLYNPLLQWFHSHPSPPQLIISDMFSGWTQNLATHLNIRRIVFSPSGSFALSAIYFLWAHVPNRQNPNDQNELVSFHTLPNSPKYPWWQVSPLFRRYASGVPGSEHFRDWFLANIASWGLVINSFNELEKPYLEHLKKELRHDRVWAVGPLLPDPEGLNQKNSSFISERGGTSSVPINDVVSWLDKRNRREVVYLCFGSQVVLSVEQTVAIGSALEKSGVHFVWSVKEGGDDRCVDFMSGFEDRMAGRGLVIRGWAPQVVILRHVAVGAFVSHCGWNSVMESVVAGVPVLAWPMSADQFVDATLLVEELKVAKKVCEGDRAVPDSDEFARVLAESVSVGDDPEATRALKLREASLQSIREGGSSDKDLRSLVGKIHSLV